MIKHFSATYLNSDANFDIYNLSNAKIEGVMYALFCVVENLLTRGCPTQLSTFLAEEFETIEMDRPVHFLSHTAPDWGNVIKGYDLENKYPATVTSEK